MALEVVAGPGTELVRNDVETAVRDGLGERAQQGDWRLFMNTIEGGFLVDLTNRDGFMRQWVFQRDEPIEYEIREALRRGL
jgi:hypothetical protein